ncbi:MAG: LysR substrate-binding domain-containing protein [Janthinobacterium lividum]
MTFLDPVLLRSFLAVADTLQFTAAARKLGMSQSTVSEHVGRLERAVDRSLLLRSTRLVELTPDGAAMVGLARDIIAAQDRALAYFDPLVLRGALRFGVSEDLVLSRLPEILHAFRLANPLVELELVVGLSFQLHEKLEAGALDLVFTKRRPGNTSGVTVWQERLIWLASPGTQLDPERPVPLVLFPGASITARAATDALDRHDRAWHLAFSSHSLSALLAAVRAGFGISAQSPVLAAGGQSGGQSGSQSGGTLVALPDTAGLPLLPVVDVVVLGRGPRLEGPVAALAEAIKGDPGLRGERTDVP